MCGDARLDQVDFGDVEYIATPEDEVIFTRTIAPEMAAMIREVGSWQLKSVGSSTAFNMLDARVVGYLTEFAGHKIRRVNATTRRQIVVALAQGISEGEGSAALARRVKKVYNGRGIAGAKAIARTETTAATGFARQNALEQAGPGLIAGKKWRAARDRRTRRSHRALDNVVVPLRRPFVTINGHRAMHPGDFGVASENVNCRCTIVPVFPRVDGQRADAFIKPIAQLEREFDRMYDRWELRLERAIRRALRMQEKQILDALERVGNE